jgi:hypothetical protein
MVKMECSGENEIICTRKHKIDGYPTVLIYVDGELKEEYPYEDEVDELFGYIAELIRLHPLEEKKEQKITKAAKEYVQRPSLPNPSPLITAIVSNPVVKQAISEPQKKTTSELPSFGFATLFLFGFVLLLGVTIYRRRRKTRYQRVHDA